MARTLNAPPCGVVVGDHSPRIGFFHSAGMLALARHASTALTSSLLVPCSLRVVLANPPQSKTHQAIRIYRHAKVL